MKLPPIFFLEDHLNPDARRAIVAMLPWLQAQGYKVVCTEFEVGDYDPNKKLADSKKQLMAKMLTGEYKPEEMALITSRDRGWPDETLIEKMINEIYNPTKPCVHEQSQLLDTLTMMALYEQLIHLKMKLSGCYPKEYPFATKEEVKNFDTSPQAIEEYNRGFMHTIERLNWENDGGVVYLVGYKHAPGLQRLLSSKEGGEQCLFFYPAPPQPRSPFERRLSAMCEGKIRTKLEPETFPLGLYVVSSAGEFKQNIAYLCGIVRDKTKAEKMPIPSELGGDRIVALLQARVQEERRLAYSLPAAYCSAPREKRVEVEKLMPDFRGQLRNARH